MLTTIKGYYDKGRIILKEDPHIDSKTEVIVTFLSGEEKSAPRTKKILGLLQGKINAPDDFNDPLDDLKEYM
jgi:hypothetical protein